MGSHDCPIPLLSQPQIPLGDPTQTVKEGQREINGNGNLPYISANTLKRVFLPEGAAFGPECSLTRVATGFTSSESLILGVLPDS